MSRQSIFCRARLEDDCMHGQPDDPEDPMDADGTFDGHSVVCLNCYVRLIRLTPSGMALNHELHPAIKDYRALHHRVKR